MDKCKSISYHMNQDMTNISYLPTPSPVLQAQRLSRISVYQSVTVLKISYIVVLYMLKYYIVLLLLFGGLLKVYYTLCNLLGLVFVTQHLISKIIPLGCG